MSDKSIISTLAAILLLTLLALLFVFHILVLGGVVPPDRVWGGQVAVNSANVVALELLALLMTLLFILIVAARAGYVKSSRLRRASRAGIWVVFAYLVLNSLGNFASGLPLETFVFGPATVVMALCAFRLALD